MVMAVIPALSPSLSLSSASATPPPAAAVVAEGGGGREGSVVHQGTLLNAVKNIFHDHGMYHIILQPS